MFECCYKIHKKTHSICHQAQKPVCKHSSLILATKSFKCCDTLFCVAWFSASISCVWDDVDACGGGENVESGGSDNISNDGAEDGSGFNDGSVVSRVKIDEFLKFNYKYMKKWMDE